MCLIRNVFVLLNIVVSGCTCNVLLIKDYLKFNYKSTVLFISCEKSFGTIQKLQSLGIWINVLDISTEAALNYTNLDRFLVRLSHPPCIVINLECNGTREFMRQISKRVLFHNERNWLMMSTSLDDAFDILHQENVNFDADILLVIPAVRKSYEIHDVFNPSYSRGGRLNITSVGKWDEEIGWNILSKHTKIERRDLNGITFPGVIPITNIPRDKTLLEHLNSNDIVHLDTMSRYMYRLFALMMEMFNFKVNLRLANMWGMKDSNGTWHGAVGALNKSEVDFGISGLRWANERYGVYEQTTAAYHAQFMFMFRHPKSVDSANVFLLPFEWKVWLAIIGLGLLSAYIGHQIFSVENHKKLKKYLTSENANEDSFSNSLLMMFGFIFQQSYSGNPLLASSRVLTTSMLIFSILIFQFYSSFIVGSLLTEPPKNIKTVKQLLNSRFEFGIDKVPYVLDNFHAATEKSTVELYNKLMQNPEKPLMPLHTGLGLLKKDSPYAKLKDTVAKNISRNNVYIIHCFIPRFSGFVFNTDGSYAYHVLKNMLTDSEKCDLQDISYIPKQPVGPGVANKSPFREMVKISIRKMTETGILSYNKKMWYGNKPSCSVSELVVVPVDIVHFKSALYILVFGIVISITIFVLENIANRWVKVKLTLKRK